MLTSLFSSFTGVSLFISLALFTLFSAVMIMEPRSLWSGVSFFLWGLGLGLFLLAVTAETWRCLPEPAVWLLVILAGAAGLLVLAFPLLLLALFLVQGVRVIQREGLQPSNLLSLGFAVLWFGFLFVWPLVGTWQKGSLGMALYLLVSLSAVYLLSLMAMYVLSALLNLVHLRTSRRFQYIIVLGAGLNGSQVTPLLAGRIDRGLQLLRRNPEARMILSGGQGPGEDLPESDAMAAYAIEHGADPSRLLLERNSTSTQENLEFSRALMPELKPRIAVVTTAYHVFRALILAKKQGIRCVGFGAKTKWYFTLNAILREFAGYLSLTRRRHIRLFAVTSLVLLCVFLLSSF